MRSLKKGMTVVLIMVMMYYANTLAIGSTEEYSNDSDIAARVQDALAADPVVGKEDIEVEIHQGTVLLSGFVGTDEQVSRAGEIASRVEGVTSVKNNIVVKEGSLGEYIDDTVITVKIKSAYAVDPMVSALDVKVVTFNGIVQLSGFVDSVEQVRKAEEIAAGIKGVKLVKNNIIVKDGEEGTIGGYIDDSVISAKVKSAFAVDKTVNALDVKVDTFNGVVQLSGFVDSVEQSRKAEEIAAGIKGVRSVRNNIIVK